MKPSSTTIIELAGEGGFWATYPEIPGANEEGETIGKTEKNLMKAILLIREDREIHRKLHFS